MPLRTLILLLLLIGTLVTSWTLQRLVVDPTRTYSRMAEEPDSYMEDFTTTLMDEQGQPKNRLQATYMASFNQKDTSELKLPRLEIYRIDQNPYQVSAKRGEVTSGNEVITLYDDVYILEQDAAGNPALEVETSKATFFPARDYAETDKYAKIVSGRFTVTGTGMRAHLNESRLEILSNVHTTIKPE